MNTGSIEHKIYFVRQQKVMLDSDLAALYEVRTGDLNRAVKRNRERFPEDFMFQLTAEETETLRCKTGILGLREHLASQTTTRRPARGKDRKYLPAVFTEQGMAMLSCVLNSRRAVQVNIALMRAFKYDSQFAVVFRVIRELAVRAEEEKSRLGSLAKENDAPFVVASGNGKVMNL